MKKILINYHKGMDLKNIDCYGVVINFCDYGVSSIPQINFIDFLNVNQMIKKSNKKSFVLIDKIFNQDEIPQLLVHLIMFEKEGVDYIIFSDMAVLSSINDKSKLIYYPKTLLSSSKEISFYNTIGCNVIISNELSIEEIEEIDKSGVNYSIEAFGYHHMFYSKRELLSLYESNFKVKGIEKNKKYFIKEETRDSYYPIVEKDDFTLIYTDYCYFLFEELLKLNNCGFVYLNSDFINIKTYLNVIKLYNNLLNGIDYKNELNKIRRSNIKLSKGFLKQKSVLLKEGANDE